MRRLHGLGVMWIDCLDRSINLVWIAASHRSAAAVGGHVWILFAAVRDTPKFKKKKGKRKKRKRKKKDTKTRTDSQWIACIHTNKCINTPPCGVKRSIDSNLPLFSSHILSTHHHPQHGPPRPALPGIGLALTPHAGNDGHDHGGGLLPTVQLRILSLPPILHLLCPPRPTAPALPSPPAPIPPAPQLPTAHPTDTTATPPTAPIPAAGVPFAASAHLPLPLPSPAPPPLLPRRHDHHPAPPPGPPAAPLRAAALRCVGPCSFQI